MSFDYKVLGKKIKEARESLLIEPHEIADLLDIDVREYGKIEKGEKYSTRKGDKYIDGDDHCVDLEIGVHNGQGQVTTPGTATVVLPSRG